MIARLTPPIKMRRLVELLFLARHRQVEWNYIQFIAQRTSAGAFTKQLVQCRLSQCLLDGSEYLIQAMVQWAELPAVALNSQRARLNAFDRVDRLDDIPRGDFGRLSRKCKAASDSSLRANQATANQALH